MGLIGFASCRSGCGLTYLLTCCCWFGVLLVVWLVIGLVGLGGLVVWRLLWVLVARRCISEFWCLVWVL